MLCLYVILTLVRGMCIMTKSEVLLDYLRATYKEVTGFEPVEAPTNERELVSAVGGDYLGDITSLFTTNRDGVILVAFKSNRNTDFVGVTVNPERSLMMLATRTFYLPEFDNTNNFKDTSKAYLSQILEERLLNFETSLLVPKNAT